MIPPTEGFSPTEAAPDATQAKLPVIVTYEDRPDVFVGAELLARSVARHVPELSFVLYSPSEELAARLSDLPNLRWVKTDDLVGHGWNVKPTILLRALAEYERVLWLDTDIIIAGDLAPRLARFDPDTVVLGQEYRARGEPGGSLRAKAHGLIPARSLPHHVNSGTVMVSRCHAPMLEAWSALLDSEAYRSAQRQPTTTRPMAFVGDQDVLWATLVSSSFADLPVGYLVNGQDTVLQYGGNGYHVLERLAALRGARPVVVHMPGLLKPWSFTEIPAPRRDLARYMHMVAYELAPYIDVARPYAAWIGNPPWLHRRTFAARLCNAFFLGNVPLRGLPLALFAWFRAITMRHRSRPRRKPG